MLFFSKSLRNSKTLIFYFHFGIPAYCSPRSCAASRLPAWILAEIIFAGCPLKTIDLPENITYIYYNAFPDSCKLYCKADTQTADELRENGGNKGNKEDYEKKLEVVEGRFKSEPNRKKTGGEYVLDQAMGEIGSIRNQLQNIKKAGLEKISQGNSIQKPAEKPEIGKVNKAPDLEKKGPGIQ